jgi:predicted nucleic acid-binding protein
MKVAFDTSVLVSGLVAAHPKHRRARMWLAAARRGELEGVMCLHAVAETWAVLTRLPLKPAISGETAKTLLSSLGAFVHAVRPTPEVYEDALARCSRAGLRSGIVFDALHLASARACGADVLVTWNRHDFERVAAAGELRIVSPDEAPGTAS